MPPIDGAQAVVVKFTGVELTANSGTSTTITCADGTMHGLQVPSGSQTGLKLVSGFSVPAGGVVAYTINFDLRQAITCPPGQAPACILKPAQRLVENSMVGGIQGAVSATLVPSGCAPAVYLYGGTVTAPEDMNSMAPASDVNQPVGSKAVVANSMPPHYFQFTFLPPGTYTVALTCQADMDNADQADSAVTFSPVKTGIAVSASMSTAADIP